jgi:2-polyprenyl-6-methoxyphenol hydroxylase-like FAD-dependent oxidoreductase
VSAGDVAIVGAGPVGQTLALLLGRQGRRVQLFEAQATPFPLPRAVHLDHQAARVLQAVGVMEELEPLTEVMDAYEWRSAGGATLLRLQPEGIGSSGWPESTMFHQPDLERLLAQRIGQCAEIEVHRGCAVTGLALAGDVVEIEAGDMTTSAAWVVGCDGARSTTRQLLDVAVTDFGYFYDWLVLDTVPEHPALWQPLNIQVCDPRRPTTAVSGGRGRRRWEFMCLPGETAEELIRPETVWRLLAPWNLTPADTILERVAIYRFEARMARQWRVGRILLAGDAAHQMPPFAGQGLCSGLHDAANLAWKLDAVLGGASLEVLDTYQSERAPQVTAAIEFSIELGKIICTPDVAAAAVRDEEMAAAARRSGAIPLPPLPPLGPGIIHRGGGDAAIQGALMIGDGPTGRFDDVTQGAGRWVLLGWGIDPAAGLRPDLAQWLTGMGAVVCVLGPAADVEGTYGRWFAALEAVAVLVRPDFAIFATASETAEINTMVHAARAALRGESEAGE